MVAGKVGLGAFPRFGCMGNGQMRLVLCSKEREEGCGDKFTPARSRGDRHEPRFAHFLCHQAFGTVLLAYVRSSFPAVPSCDYDIL